MSEIDDLESIVGERKQREECQKGMRTMFENSHRAIREKYREGSRLRLSGNAPSLPKLKFLEGKD